MTPGANQATNALSTNCDDAGYDNDNDDDDYYYFKASRCELT